jgi:predicted  nucleic acid-binding Zn-ribbon protein
MTQIQNSAENTNNSWKTTSIVLGLLLLGAIIFGVTFYSKYKATDHKATDLGTQLDSTRTELQGQLAELNLNYTDQIALNDTLSVELQEKVAQVNDLQVRIEKARKALKNSEANNAQIKARLAQMEELKVALERDILGLKEENASLTASNQELNTELTTTKDEVNTLNSKVMSLTQANEKLTGRLKTVAPAGFRADNFTVTSATKKDKLTTKGKKIDEITVTFDLNNIPEEYQGNRELYLVLTEFNGNPVASVPGKEVNLKFGSEPVHLRAADIEKTSLKARQSMSMSFEPTDVLIPGTYNVMVYADSGYLGSTGFLVSK